MWPPSLSLQRVTFGLRHVRTPNQKYAPIRHKRFLTMHVTDHHTKGIRYTQYIQYVVQLCNTVDHTVDNHPHPHFLTVP